MSHIDVFQEEVLQAYQRFVSEVAAAAKRAAHGIAEAAISAAFDQVLGPLVRTLAAPPASVHLPEEDAALRGFVAASTDPVAPRERLLAAIRGNPGSTTAQLRHALSLRVSPLLRHLRALIQEGAIRVEQQASSFPGQHRKLYFVVEAEIPERHANGEAIAERRLMGAP